MNDGGSATRGRPHFGGELDHAGRRRALSSSRAFQSPKHLSGKNFNSFSLVSPCLPAHVPLPKQYSRPGTPSAHGSHQPPPFFPSSGTSSFSTPSSGFNTMASLAGFQPGVSTSGSTTPTLLASHISSLHSGRHSHALMGGGSLVTSPLPSPVGTMVPFDDMAYIQTVVDSRRVFHCTVCGMYVEQEHVFSHRVECSVPGDHSFASTPLTRSRSASPRRHLRSLAASAAAAATASNSSSYPLSPSAPCFGVGAAGVDDKGVDDKVSPLHPLASTSPLPLSALAMRPAEQQHYTSFLQTLPPISSPQQPSSRGFEPFPRATANTQYGNASGDPLAHTSGWADGKDASSWGDCKSERGGGPCRESNGSRRRSPPLAPLAVPSAHTSPWPPPGDLNPAHVCSRHSPDQVFHKLGDSYRCVGLVDAFAAVPNGEDPELPDHGNGQANTRKFTIHVLQRCGGSSTKRYRKHMYLPDCDCGVAPFRSKLDVTQHMLSSKHQQPICDVCSELFPSYQARNSHRLRCAAGGGRCSPTAGAAGASVRESDQRIMSGHVEPPLSQFGMLRSI